VPWEKHRDDIQVLLPHLVISNGISGYYIAEALLAAASSVKVISTSGSGRHADQRDIELIVGSNSRNEPDSRTGLLPIIRTKLDEPSA